MKMLHAVLIFLAQTVAQAKGVASCPEQCICYEQSIACSCEEKNLDELIISSLGHTFISSLTIHSCDKSPKQFVIEETTIRKLAPMALSGLSHVEHIWFREADVDVIATEAFNYVAHVAYIYFYRSRIGRIERRAFSGMTRVSHVFFKEKVSIGAIEGEAFATSSVDDVEFEKVEARNVDDNFIDKINADDFRIRKSTFLFVARNDIAVLGDEEIKPFNISRCEISNSNINAFSPKSFPCLALGVISTNFSRLEPLENGSSNPAKLKSLWFVNCTIDVIKDDVFGRKLDRIEFNRTKIGQIQFGAFGDLEADKIALHESRVQQICSKSFSKSTLRFLLLDDIIVDEIESTSISNAKIGTLFIKSSTILSLGAQIFENSTIGTLKLDKTRIREHHREAMNSYSKMETLWISESELRSQSSTPLLPSASRSQPLPLNLVLTNNTFDCAIPDCGTNVYLTKNSLGGRETAWQVADNRCRNFREACRTAPVSPFVEHGLECRLTWALADCRCLEPKATLPFKEFHTLNISVLTIGDCDQLEVADTASESSLMALYVFRTGRIDIQELPESLQTAKFFHSRLLLHDRPEPPSRVELTNLTLLHSSVSKIGKNAFARMKIGEFFIHNSIVPIVPISATRGTKIDRLTVLRGKLGSTKALFDVSRHLVMHESLVFTTIDSLASIESAQMQNNTVLCCCGDGSGLSSNLKIARRLGSCPSNLEDGWHDVRCETEFRLEDCDKLPGGVELEDDYEYDYEDSEEPSEIRLVRRGVKLAMTSYNKDAGPITVSLLFVGAIMSFNLRV
ncbi:unnamed protein product [Caenorhabditis auriculariae]|uniref:Receptor L-domain domain-containing protein n=1 Tax=Caenorhabditis auriculariae TaxID=2777116 RepID=A0A8S1GVI9_9PELO|nr:unnamed protein product [Caenorhabditis auriculariae]